MNRFCSEVAAGSWSPELANTNLQEAGADHPIDILSRNLALRCIARHAPSPCPVILDVGCDNGLFLKHLIRNMPHASLIGSDIVGPTLDRIAGELAGVSLMQFDITRCPLSDETLDVVVMMNVLEHIDDDAAAVASAWRILKPDGILYIEVPSGPWLYDVYDEVFLHRRRYAMRRLKQIVTRSGFVVQYSTHIGFGVYPGFVASKLINKLRNPKDVAAKTAHVKRQIRSTRSNPIMRALCGVEGWAGRMIRYPLGIRCVIVCKKVGG